MADRPDGSLTRLKSLSFLHYCFVGVRPRNKTPVQRNHFPLLAETSGNSGWLSLRQQKRRAAPALETGDSQMRTFSFLLAFAFVLAGPSMAGSTDGGLPGIGSFAYNGSPITASTPEAIIVAAR
jgi:hypothetical protein